MAKLTSSFRFGDMSPTGSSEKSGSDDQSQTPSDTTLIEIPSSLAANCLLWLDERRRSSINIDITSDGSSISDTSEHSASSGLSISQPPSDRLLRAVRADVGPRPRQRKHQMSKEEFTAALSMSGTPSPKRTAFLSSGLRRSQVQTAFVESYLPKTRSR